MEIRPVRIRCRRDEPRDFLRVVPVEAVTFPAFETTRVGVPFPMRGFVVIQVHEPPANGMGAGVDHAAGSNLGVTRFPRAGSRIREIHNSSNVTGAVRRSSPETTYVVVTPSENAYVMGSK